MIKITIVGNGNVGSNLSKAFNKKRLDTQIISHKQLSDINLNEPRLIFLCVPDDFVEETAKKVKISDNIIVCHVAGSVPLESISKYHKNSGVFYPLQSFSKGREVDLQQVPIILEACTQEVLDALTEVAKLISDQVVFADSKTRKHIHLAAVFINNYSNLMFQIGNDIIEEHNLDRNLMNALILETVSKAMEFGPERMQTGPAKRGDIKTIQEHLSMLSEDKAKVYEVLSDYLMKKYK